MSICSDKWINQMAQEQQMIVPFEPQQIKQNAQGRAPYFLRNIKLRL